MVTLVQAVWDSSSPASLSLSLTGVWPARASGSSCTCCSPPSCSQRFQGKLSCTPSPILASAPQRTLSWHTILPEDSAGRLLLQVRALQGFWFPKGYSAAGGNSQGSTKPLPELRGLCTRASAGKRGVTISAGVIGSGHQE